MSNATYRSCNKAASQVPTIPTVANCFHSKAKRFQTNRATRNYVRSRSMNLWIEYVQDMWGCGVTAPRILNLGNRGIWMVSFKPRSLRPGINKMGEPQSKSGRCGDEKNNFLMLGIEPRFLSRPECRYRCRGDDDIVTSHLSSQSIQRFVARQHLRNMQQ
jgi:hypothetical protein